MIKINIKNKLIQRESLENIAKLKNYQSSTQINQKKLEQDLQRIKQEYVSGGGVVPEYPNLQGQGSSSMRKIGETTSNCSDSQ